MSVSRLSVLLALLWLPLMVSCSGGPKVIPKKKMVKIYADMFVADQWISQNYKASRTADTTVVYEAVFEKYGYDADDYRASVEYYIKDPDRFARILRQTVLELEDRMDVHKAELRKIRAIEAAEPDITYEFDFSRIWIFENGYPRLADRDSLDYFRASGEYFVLDLKPLAEPDGPEDGWRVYFPQDTVVTPDTSETGIVADIADSTATADTLPVSGAVVEND